MPSPVDTPTAREPRFRETTICSEREQWRISAVEAIPILIPPFSLFFPSSTTI
jgi:hypothetical protein